MGRAEVVVARLLALPFPLPLALVLLLLGVEVAAAAAAAVEVVAVAALALGAWVSEDMTACRGVWARVFRSFVAGVGG